MDRRKVRKLQLHAAPLCVRVRQDTMATHACILVPLILTAPCKGPRTFITALFESGAIVGLLV
eukprot:1341336-Pyramimonas_sp.AAC.1